ncbi:MAG: hypothetical protein RL497_1062, partial [Pseudomonadota bacterium]
MPTIYIAATGMITPVGQNTANTQAAIAAGISASAISIHYNKNYSPMRMALIPEQALPPLNPLLDSVGLSPRQKRLLRIATPALIETISQLPPASPPALFLALPESIPGCPFIAPDNFLVALETQSGVTLNKAVSKIFSSGRAGGIEAIKAAIDFLSDSGSAVALVGGVDTYADLLLLGVLDSANRILADNISDAFVPGEAAGFLLLVSEQAKNYLPHPPKAIIYPPGIASESGHRYSDEAYRGDGLAQAFTQAIQNGQANLIESIFSSLNGESFGAKELGVAFIRNKSAFAAQAKTEHPADCIGDVGAAFAPILIANALYTQNTSQLCYCSSENAN